MLIIKEQRAPDLYWKSSVIFNIISLCWSRDINWLILADLPHITLTNHVSLVCPVFIHKKCKGFQMCLTVQDCKLFWTAVELGLLVFCLSFLSPVCLLVFPTEWSGDRAIFRHHMGAAADHRLVHDLSSANPVLGDPRLVQESASHFVQPPFISKECKESTSISRVCMLGLSLCLLVSILALSTSGQAFIWWIHSGGFFCICTNFVPSLVQFAKFVYNV